MSKCIGGVAHDAVGSLATHKPGKSFGDLFEEKKAQLDTLQAGLASAVLPKTPPMPAVKYRDSTLKGASIIILAYPYRYITRKHNVWARELDIYGRTCSEVGEVGFIPFLYQGQYLDGETGLAYNRFLYYSPETGAYISQDPIRLEAGLTNLYAYVHDVNAWVDPWGLKGIIPAILLGTNNEILEATATITKMDLGGGSGTNKSSRSYARSLGNIDDDVGHIIGKNLGGSGGKKNVFPQDFHVNRGEFAQFEARVADLVDKHGSASIKGSFEYGNGGTRPTRIHYEAIAPNGDRIGKIFNNSH